MFSQMAKGLWIQKCKTLFVFTNRQSHTVLGRESISA